MITESGTVTDLRFASMWGNTIQCTKLSGDGIFSGGASDGTSMTVDTWDRWSCSGGGAGFGREFCLSGVLEGPTIECNRWLTVSVTKQ
jgi:hypothetical protein